MKTDRFTKLHEALDDAFFDWQAQHEWRLWQGKPDWYTEGHALVAGLKKQSIERDREIDNLTLRLADANARLEEHERLSRLAQVS